MVRANLGKDVLILRTELPIPAVVDIQAKLSVAIFKYVSALAQQTGCVFNFCTTV